MCCILDLINLSIPATLIRVGLQKKVNLSIQLPKDDSSLLPVHSDVWQGDSPYELVLWIPLVNCAKTKSMYILPKQINGADKPPIHD